MADANREAVIRMLMQQRDNPSAFDEHWQPMPPERSAIASALMGVRDKIPENPDTQWSAANMLRGGLERSANLQDTVAGYRDPKTADPLDLVPMLAPGAIAGALRGPARSTLMSAGGVPPKDAPGFTAYHGSPHEFDRFSMDKIGTGEGAQAYGHGLYFADAEPVARSYKETLTSGRLSAAGEAEMARRLNAEMESEIAKALRDPGWQGGGFWDEILSAERARLGDDLSDRDLLRKYVERDPAGAREAAEYAIDKRPIGSRIRDDLVQEGKFAHPGHMYEVRIKADPNDFLDWDKPLNAQSDKVRKALGFDMPEPEFKKAQTLASELNITDARLGARPGAPDLVAMRQSLEDQLKGTDPKGFARWRMEDLADSPEMTAKLRDAGIPGIRYDDQLSRGASGGTRNTVVFDDKLIEIIRKYGLAAALMGGGAAAMGGPSSPAAASQ